jgi:hypothetical protein
MTIPTTVAAAITAATIVKVRITGNFCGSAMLPL